MNTPHIIPYKGYEIVISEDPEQYTFRIFKGGVHQSGFNFAVSKAQMDDISLYHPFEDIEELFDQFIQLCKSYIDIITTNN